MRIFRFYSTSNKSDTSGDSIVNLNQYKLESIHPWFDEKDNQFVINIHLNGFRLSEVHDDLEITRTRIADILVAFGADEYEATKYASLMKFIKK